MQKNKRRRDNTSMIRYKNLGGNSSISQYEIGVDYIVVEFYGSVKMYKYTYRTAGKANIENAKKLAIRGFGLGSFIQKNMKYNFER